MMIRGVSLFYSPSAVHKSGEKMGEISKISEKSGILKRSRIRIPFPPAEKPNTLNIIEQFSV